MLIIAPRQNFDIGLWGDSFFLFFVVVTFCVFFRVSESSTSKAKEQHISSQVSFLIFQGLCNIW